MSFWSPEAEARRLLRRVGKLPPTIADQGVTMDDLDGGRQRGEPAMSTSRSAKKALPRCRNCGKRAHNARSCPLLRPPQPVNEAALVEKIADAAPGNEGKRMKMWSGIFGELGEELVVAESPRRRREPR